MAAPPAPPASREDAVRVAPVTAALAPAVRALRADPGQYAFVGDVQANLIDSEADPGSEPMAILCGGAVVGFYRIDLAPRAIDGCQYGACAALRSVLVDRSRQGQGLGTRALRACVADLERRHPRLRLLALTVNCANAAALHAYRKAGFVDSGRLYYGGRAGPQHLLLRRLGPAGVGESPACSPATPTPPP